MNTPCIEEIMFIEHELGPKRSLAHLEIWWDSRIRAYTLDVHINPDTYEIMGSVAPIDLDDAMQDVNLRVDVLDGLCEHVNTMVWDHIKRTGHMLTDDEQHTWAYHAMLWLLSSTPPELLNIHNINICDADTSRRKIMLGYRDGAWPERASHLATWSAMFEEGE